MNVQTVRPHRPRAMLCALSVGLASLATLGTLTGCSKSASAPEADPLLEYQWHLKNTGQGVFSDQRPVPGIDLDMGTLFEEGITGKGVIVGLLDRDRANADHEDLARNMVIPHARSTSTDARSAMHATAVAAIIAAAANNGKGGRGIAPEVRILDLTADIPPGTPAPRLIDNSLGAQTPRFMPYTHSEIRRDDDALDNPAQPLIFRAAGDSFLALAPDAARALCAATTRGSGVGCISAVVDPASANPLSVTVGAVNAAGQKASYSATGSALWISGLGGEAGSQRAYRLKDETAEALGKMPRSDFAPGLVTADAPGCAQGLNQEHSSYNALDSGARSVIERNCNYTARFSGTAVAAATVTGVAALLLQVNPKLSWWDIKYLLATTARKIDPTQKKTRWNDITLDGGWTTNAAGHPFSNSYGFGLADASRAVAAARHFNPLPQPHFTAWSTSITQPLTIPYHSESEGYSTIALDDNLKCDTVQIRLKTTHKMPGNLRILLVSPAGTRSVLLPALTLLMPTPDGFVIDLAASNAFLDESAKGTWKLQVMDMLDPSSDGNATLTSWQLRVLGRPAS
ncbi:S8 family serine peptidase [Paraburkholderia hayleyella]|uniref:S8 family serine peptidase n=1 Tax=Paraburkholderia hayleyella TaxID=2152889 RepID=UPI0012926A1F|nr:S8 family serine peptidase [Paraburkholderia hayleyella]